MDGLKLFNLIMGELAERDREPPYVGCYSKAGSVWLVALLSTTLVLQRFQSHAAEFAHGMVASGHPTATDAGLKVLKNGGNAVDAAVAVALTLGVVDGDNAGI